jgi:hypothetical protein
MIALDEVSIAYEEDTEGESSLSSGELKELDSLLDD